jgi:hypothetical protein
LAIFSGVSRCLVGSVARDYSQFDQRQSSFALSDGSSNLHSDVPVVGAVYDCQKESRTGRRR